MKKLNPILDDLISLFSYDAVFAPKNETINLNIQNIVNIYNILNKHIFSSSLKILPMQFANEFIGTNHLAGYNYRFVLLKDANAYTLVTKPTRIPSGKILMPPSILLNPCLSSGITLMLVVNSLVHEMIHQDDVENGTLLQRRYDSKMKGEKDFNSHKGYFENFNAKHY